MKFRQELKSQPTTEVTRVESEDNNMKKAERLKGGDMNADRCTKKGKNQVR